MMVDGQDSSNTSGVWPNESYWQFVNPGDSITDDCKNWYKNTKNYNKYFSTNLSI